MQDNPARFIEEKDPTRSVDHSAKREQQDVQKPKASREIINPGNWHRHLAQRQREGARPMVTLNQFGVN
jgi:hypothetical protein